MLPRAADEDFDNDIVRGLLRRQPGLNIVRVQDVGLSGADDPTVLDWAAREQRVLLTHDVSTMPRHVDDRVRAGLAMPGVIEVSHADAIGRVIDDVLLLAECGLPGELEGQVLFLPLK